jgi:hypothetical protein
MIRYQVWVANIEMAIRIVKATKGKFCTQETPRLLQTLLVAPAPACPPAKPPTRRTNHNT